MAQYVLFVWGPAEPDELFGYASETAVQEMMSAVGAFNERLREQGQLIYANGLGAASAGTVIDGRGPESLVTDGPYVEFKEWINGLWILEAADRDEALAIAAEASRVCDRKLELREAG